MDAKVQCPCCDFQGELTELEEPPGAEAFVLALREHVLWTHYRTGDWGHAPSGMLAAQLFLHLGVLEEEEAIKACDRAFEAETPRPGWLNRHGQMWLLAGVWFLWGSIETYVWITNDDWWVWAFAASLALVVCPALSYLAYRRVWKGHPTAKQLRRFEEQKQAYEMSAPDTVPEEWSDANP